MISNYLVMYVLMGTLLAASLGAFVVAGWAAVRFNGHRMAWQGLIRYALAGLGVLLVSTLLAGEAASGGVLLLLVIASQALVAGYLGPRPTRSGPPSNASTVPRWRFAAIAVPLSLLLLSLLGVAALFILNRLVPG